MEETVPIIHSTLMRRNRNLGENPYGVKVSYLSVTICADARKLRPQTANDSARIGA
jgi:hypothetical protein